MSTALGPKESKGDPLGDVLDAGCTFCLSWCSSSRSRAVPNLDSAMAACGCTRVGVRLKRVGRAVNGKADYMVGLACSGVWEICCMRHENDYHMSRAFVTSV